MEKFNENKAGRVARTNAREADESVVTPCAGVFENEFTTEIADEAPKAQRDRQRRRQEANNLTKPY